jgi:four helix bundle protein
MKGHRDLVVWRKAMGLVRDIYGATSEFPRNELYGLTGQIRRTAVSVPSNIAEGHGRGSVRELKQFVSQARGSLLELQTQLEIAHDLRYLPQPSFVELMAKSDDIGRMLTGLRLWCQQRERR